MKDQELELQVAPMSNDTMEYLNVLFGVCKRFKTDYYHATPKQREFIDAVATHEYQLMKAHEKGLSRASVPPFMGMKRSERSNNIWPMKKRIKKNEKSSRADNDFLFSFVAVQ